MAFTPSAPHKRPRWLALLVIVAVATAVVAPTVLAANPFTSGQYQLDQGGANDQPNQKDLTGQIAGEINGVFYSSWAWDDIAWNGGNTGDACSLFDTDGDGKANYAVCVTVAGNPAVETSTRVYSCGDDRADRCSQPTVLLGSQPASGTWCSVETGGELFTAGPGTTDLFAYCNIDQIATGLTPQVPGLAGGNLINSCSYPSEEPNSDPSDCVIEIALTNVTVSTQSGGTITWTATLSDTATLNPTSATGSVVFKLYSDSACTSLIWTSPADTTAPFSSGTTGGSPSGGNVITNLTVDTDGIYYWIAEYTATGFFVSDNSACGEATTIVASVTGSSGS